VYIITTKEGIGMGLTSFSRIVMATVLAVAGVASQAQAFVFTEGDVVLAIWGNNTEALYNLGTIDTAFTAVNQTLDVSAGLAAAQSGVNPVRFSVFGASNFTGQIIAGTTTALSAVNRDLVNITQQLGVLGTWGPFSNFSGNTISRSDAASFSSRMDIDGPSLNGTWPVDMYGSLGSILNILSGVDQEPGLTQIGRVLLAANGILTYGNPGPAAVPLPAAVILFGSGLIGLVGLARRSATGRAA
jgi:hypothetical protein